MALWKISDVWMGSSAPGAMERAGISNALALAVPAPGDRVRVSTYGQYGQEGCYRDHGRDDENHDGDHHDDEHQRGNCGHRHSRHGQDQKD